MKKLSRNGLWDHVRTFILSGLVRGTLAGEIFYLGWSRGPGSSISAARAGPVAISDVLWHGPVPWSFNPDIFWIVDPPAVRVWRGWLHIARAVAFVQWLLRVTSRSGSPQRSGDMQFR